MERREINHFSAELGHDMRMLIYGKGGCPLLGFPTQDAMCDNYENFGMTDTIRDYIEDGRIMLFCVDSVDRESWSDAEGDPGYRAYRQECYYRYIVEEVLPLIRGEYGEEVLPYTTGFSMGANHAANLFFRRPDLFAGVLGLSGVYDSGCFFGGYMDSTLYDNSPEIYLANMPEDHPYIPLYNRRRIILCVGQGAWEEDGIRSLRKLSEIFHRKGIDAWVDYWGYDVNHDWPWWKKQIRYFLPFLLEEGN